MTNNNIKCIMFICIYLLAGLLFGVEAKNASADRISDQPGETHPITVETAIGTNFNITCYMNPNRFPGKNSTCLNFVIGKTNKELPRENILILNATTIIYMVRNAEEQQAEYRCKCGHKQAIMETKVFVGSRPRPIKDFSCRSYDFKYMICNFTIPTNPILTTYNVTYYNEHSIYIYQPQCDYDFRNRVVCNVSLSERHYEMYHFSIRSRNALVNPNETLVQRFDINNFEIMIPDMPGANIHSESLTVDSIKLCWKMATWEKYRQIGLEWHISLQPENMTIMERNEFPVREHNAMCLRLHELPYAFWQYKLKIRVRVINTKAIWSEMFTYTFQTAACRPQRPPNVQPGSFYIDTTETRITVYWEELMPFEHNGDNFTYAITSINSNTKLSDLKPWHQEKNFAKFYWQKDFYYEFEIRSKNHVGESKEASRLIIYPTNHRNPKEFTPQNIHNVYHGNNNSYTLTWSKPRNLTGLLSFTVFWCYPKLALPNECKESIHFQQIPGQQINFTTQPQNASEERTLNLAVSANYEKFNTGLHWTDCSMDIVNAEFVKMEPELVAFSNSIKVQWSVERVCPSILDGFNITYCEVVSNTVPENATCQHNKSITKLAKNYDKKYFIHELKPFTIYKVTMFMFWRTKQGRPSEPQIIRTLEGAPSPPRQLRVEDITNTSATINWFEPTHTNGKIRKYIIMLNNDQIEVNASTLSYHLDNLESFTAYKVYVLAETVERSETSNDVHFTTAIGVPSPPGIGSENNVNNIMQWSKPVKPRGPIELYEVLVTEMRNHEILRRRISIIVGSANCSFSKFHTCIGSEYETKVEVRAVNINAFTDKTGTNLYNSQRLDDIYFGNEELECMPSDTKSLEYIENIQKYMNAMLYESYKSPWQTLATYSCSTSRLSKITVIALVIVAMSLGVMAALYMARKKYIKMSNIDCTLPTGLLPYLTNKAESSFHGDFNTSGLAIKEESWTNAATINDYISRNEYHHLLASQGNDSVGVVNNSGDTANISEHNEMNNDDAEEYENNHLKECTNSVSSAADSLVGSTEGSDCNDMDLDHSPVTIFPNNNDYIKQSMLQPWQTFNNRSDDNSNGSDKSGYITVQNLNNALNKASHQPDFVPTTGGYVLQQDLQNLFVKNTPNTNTANSPSTTTTLDSISAAETLPQFNSGGYTTLESLSNLIATQNESQQQEASNINRPPQLQPAESNPDDAMASKPGVISGYVTQQDLNIFAQHQHNH